MKIECVRTHRLECRLAEPFAFAQWSYDRRKALLVEIVDSDGRSGWGECYGPAEVAQAAVATYYAPKLIGRDPLQTDRLWHLMWRTSLDYARRGVMMGAISGIDMALWDLKGKALGLSVADLMGGRVDEQVTCYATGLYFREMREDQLVAALVEEATGYHDQGFRAMKVKLGKNMSFDEEILKAIRRALPETTLMADANHAYDLREATRIGRLLDELGYAWFEEPLSPELAADHARLRAKIDTPLATGECEQTRWGFQSLLSAGGVDIAQPDIAYCGGPSEALKIRAVASSLGVNVVPHAWGTMFNLAAAVHFLASNHAEPGRAERAGGMLEYDRSPNALRDELFTTPLAIERAVARVPTRPGLGVEIDRSAMNGFLRDATECRA